MTTNYILKPDIYLLRGTFLKCRNDDEQRKLIILNKEIIDEYKIQIDEDVNVNQFVIFVKETFNAKITAFLDKSGIIKWYPSRNITCTISETTINEGIEDKKIILFEICYYHDVRIHEIIYGKINEGIIMRPLDHVIGRLNEFYKTYDLTYDSDEICSTILLECMKKKDDKDDKEDENKDDKDDKEDKEIEQDSKKETEQDKKQKEQDEKEEKERLREEKKKLRNKLKNTVKKPLPTTVVDVHQKSLGEEGYQNFEQWVADPINVYIGRNMSYAVKGAKASKWHNPFSVKKYGLEKCIEMYEEHVRKNKDLMDSLEELKGKTLGCWCHPKPCHGDVLVKLVNEKFPENKDAQIPTQEVQNQNVQN